MKELLFYNKPNQDPGSPQVLIIKLSERSWSYVTTNQTGSELYSVCYCRTEDAAEGIAAFEKEYPVLGYSYYDIKIIFDFPRSMVLPYSETTAGDTLPLLNNLYGYPGSSVAVTENISPWQMKNMYAVPAELFDWVRKKFPASQYLHQYSVTILNLNPVADEGKLLVDFRNNEFSVVAGRRNKFLLAQSFVYETPEDVLFYLLKVCEQFSLSPKDVVVKLSGLIEKESSLYKELYQYFINIDFRNANWNAAGDYPAHFFTSFNDMIQCAS